MIAFFKVLRPHLLTLGKYRLRFADFQRSSPSTGINTLYRGGHQFLMTALEFLHHLPALAVADSLTDDVPGGLRRDSAKFLGVQMYADFISYSRIRIDLAGIQQGNLLSFICNFLRHGFS